MIVRNEFEMIKAAIYRMRGGQVEIDIVVLCSQT